MAKDEICMRWKGYQKELIGDDCKRVVVIGTAGLESRRVRNRYKGEEGTTKKERKKK